MIVTLTLGLLAGPLAGNVPGEDSGRFHYDAKSGLCGNDSGQTGLNPISLAEIEKTKDGECANLRFQLNGDNLRYPLLKDWNLKGADLSKARLFFALLIDADLRGARLEGFEYGYAEIRGLIDAFTKLPVGDRGKYCLVKDTNKLVCKD